MLKLSLISLTLSLIHIFKKILKSRGLETAVGDEGGFAPRFDGTEDGVETILAVSYTHLDVYKRQSQY